MFWGKRPRRLPFCVLLKLVLWPNCRPGKEGLTLHYLGVMAPPQGSKTKQGYELQLGTNCVAPFLLTKLLMPILLQTAKTAPAESVRVVWTSSIGAEFFSPKKGVNLDNMDYKNDQSRWHKYGVSKAGNIFHGQELARRYGGEGIISVVSIS